MDEKSIRELIRESLNLLKEGQASFLDDKIESVQEHIIDVAEKKIESLKKQEEAARDKEEYNELQSIKGKQVSTIDMLIKGYTRKVALLKQIQADLEGESSEIGEKGNRVFKGKELQSFSSESFGKGNKLQFNTISSSTTVMKIADYNSFRVLGTDMQGLKVNDLLQISDLNSGGEGKIVIWRNENGEVEKKGSSKLGTILKLIKNPE